MAFVGSCLPFAVVDILDLRIVVAVVEASDRRIAILKVASSTVCPSFVEVAFVQAVLEIVGEASCLVDPSFTVAFGLGITAMAFPFVVEASSIAVMVDNHVSRGEFRPPLLCTRFLQFDYHDVRLFHRLNCLICGDAHDQKNFGTHSNNIQSSIK